MFFQTLRSLFRQKGFAVSVALIMALGIGVNAAVFSIAYSVLFPELPFRAPNELVMISEASRNIDTGLVSPTAFLEWRDRKPPFSEMAAFMWWEGSSDDPTLTVTITPNYFDVLGVKPLLGRTFTEEENRVGMSSAMILSYEIWQRRFGGDPGVIGRTVRDGNWSPRIVGVMPPAPINLNIGWGHIWRPIRLRQQYNRAEIVSARYLRVVGRLRHEADRAQAAAALTRVQQELQKVMPDIFKGYDVRMTGLREALAGEYRPAVLILLATAGCLLLLTCASLANMLVARSAAQERELAVRVALGATRSDLALRVLSANLILASVGAALGFAFCRTAIAVIAHFEPAMGGAQTGGINSWQIVCVCAGIALVTALLVSAPVIVGVGRTSLHDALKEGGRSGKGGRRARRVRGLLVSAEVALAVSLLVASGLLTRSFLGLMGADLGFNPDNVLLLESNIGDSYYNNNARRIAYYRPLLQSISELPAVASVGGLRYFPMHARLWITPVQIKEHPVPAAEQPVVYYNRVAGDYFDTMRIPLIAGRFPSAKEMWEGSESVLINAAAANQLFPDGKAVGKHIGDSQSHEIIGVVGNVRQAGLGRPPGPEIYSLMAADESTGVLTIAIRTRHPPDREALQSIGAAVRHYTGSASPPALIPMKAFLANTIAARRAAGRLGAFFALLSLLIATLGIYGLVSYSVTQRTGEFGIRAAIGASAGGLIRLVLRDCLQLAGAGILIGAAASFFVSRLIASLLSGIAPFDPAVLLTAAVLIVAVSLLAALKPAFRAGRINAIDALRAE